MLKDRFYLGSCTVVRRTRGIRRPGEARDAYFIAFPCRLSSKTAPTNRSDSWCLLIAPRSYESKAGVIKITPEKLKLKRPRSSASLSGVEIPSEGVKCSPIGTALRRTGVKVSSVAVTLKQWWRDVGLCPRPPRATIGTIASTTKHRCRRARPMGHSLSMCKLQHCRHKKSKFHTF